MIGHFFSLDVFFVFLKIFKFQTNICATGDCKHFIGKQYIYIFFFKKKKTIRGQSYDSILSFFLLFVSMFEDFYIFVILAKQS
jgi:hypothetical protein